MRVRGPRVGMQCVPRVSERQMSPNEEGRRSAMAVSGGLFLLCARAIGTGAQFSRTMPDLIGKIENAFVLATFRLSESGK